VLRGARVARDALQVVAVRTPTPHADGNRSHRVSIEIRIDPRLCSNQACFQPLSSRIIDGTVVGSDSVAERIAPLLSMLTVEVYDQSDPHATKIGDWHQPRTNQRSSRSNWLVHGSPAD
jgi:hypothetical protein